MNLLLAFFFLSAALFADMNSTDINKSASSTSFVQNTKHTQNSQKVIYLGYEEIPSRVVQGEIFSITIKTLCTVKNFTDITYELSNLQGIELLSDYPSRRKDEKYYYETFHFLAISKYIRLPDITATLIDDKQTPYKKTTLHGQDINVISLNPPGNFSNIIANSFEIVEYKTTSYDTLRNIVIFVAVATNSDIGALRLHQDVYKQGIESITESYFDSKITYYVIVDKSIENLSFSYFNLLKNKFLSLSIPIIVTEDSVTTQSDLRPTNQSHEIIKMVIAATIAFVAFFIILWRRKFIYLVFILLPLGYILSIVIPSKEICIKRGSKIYLLPVENGTIFETTPTTYYLQKENEVKGWSKVQLTNEKIGWVKNEDICSR